MAELERNHKHEPQEQSVRGLSCPLELCLIPDIQSSRDIVITSIEFNLLVLEMGITGVSAQSMGSQRV